MTDGTSAVTLDATSRGLRLDYALAPGGWGDAVSSPGFVWPEDRPLTFTLRAGGAATLEVKAVDADGSNHLRRLPLSGAYRDATPVTLYRRDLEYGWGGDEALGATVSFHAAVSGAAGRGTVWIEDLGLGTPGAPGSFPPDAWLDPHRDDPGLGFVQRRAPAMTPEDPLVLEWFKRVQDTASPEKRLLPSMEDGLAQTFNNALAAMVFALKGEKARAERILDYFARATRRDNADPALQNFFLRGEARGFYQNVFLRDAERPAGRTPPHGDRWVGDMAWLLIAYEHYGSRYGPDRYREVTGLLKDLLVSFYVPSGDGGYVRHGWRDDDARLHEPEGHGEANIDASAAFRLCGEIERAESVRRWLEAGPLRGRHLPLDLTTWRVLAFGPSAAPALARVEADLRYRKTLRVGDREVAGFFHSPAPEVSNLWLDGIGHAACAHFSLGDEERGNFYANQLDAFLMDRTVGGRRTRALPYTANHDGGFEWVALDRGFVSAAAWYVFAKNRFNPMTLRTAERSPR